MGVEMNRPAALSLTASGAFVVGCNYWASHAGTAMWADWRPEVVEADLKQLAAEGLQVLRVFPLWPDFQPLTPLYGGHGHSVELRCGERPLPPDGMSHEALARFAAFADLAHKYGLKLIVGLLTGWMSGRLFAPPALQGRNLLTDPLAIQWEVRFVRHFVRRFREHPAILAWDLGNECNCMAPVPSSEAAWVWTATIANAVRAEDAGRPVVSGMHSLDEPDRNGPWRIADQGELTDLLTTHPYPHFTPHCDQEPINTTRNGLHATAQSRWYADVGGKPCLAEEVGTLGPMFASESVAAAYARMALFSLWAHDCHGLLWWCAYDQDRLEHAPYDWNPIERELGLIRADRSPKPVIQELGKFARWLNALPLSALPPRLTEAVCILTQGQEQWGVAFASFILAKQAGFDLTFQYADQPLREAGLYLLPSVRGDSGFSRRFWHALDARVRAGATLYLSHDTAMLSPFEEPFGLEIQTRERRTGPAEFTVDDVSYTVPSPVKLRLEPTRAQVLGRERDGNPVLARAAHGQGETCFLSVPIERAVSETPGSVYPDAQPLWQIYRHVAQPFLGGRVVGKDLPQVGVTEHPLDERRRVVVLINYSPAPVEVAVTVTEGWMPGEAWYGERPRAGYCALGANDAAVFTVEK